MDGPCPATEVAEFGTHWFTVYEKKTCYAVLSQPKMIFKDAIKFCETRNGALAMPKSDEENKFLVTFMKDLDVDESVWLGIEKKDGSKTQYLDNTKVDKFYGKNKWADMFSVFRPSEFYVALDPDGRGQWQRERSGIEKKPFICEWS